MALYILPTRPFKPLFFPSCFTSSSSSSFSSISFSTPTRPSNLPICLAAAKSQPGPPLKKRSSSSSSSSKKAPTKKKNSRSKNGDDDISGLRDIEIVKGGDVEIVRGGEGDDVGYSNSSSSHPMPLNPTMPLPKPPAGFVLDESGRVILASTNRIITIVDSANNYPLDCVVRRVFRSSIGEECMLLCPVDTPVQILKSTNADGWSAVSDEEVEDILPAAAYALAKIHMHLVHSGFCYTARGGFCYSEDDILDFRTDDGQDVDGLPTEGVEITCFQLDSANYMIYTPSDPLLFVAAKDQNGLLQIADDDLLDDPATMNAIDEETEFNALVEEEAALLESLIGER